MVEYSDMRKILLTVLIMIAPSVMAEKLPCPEKLTMTLQDAIILSMRNNPAIQSALLQRTVDKYALLVAKREFRPQFTLQFRAHYANGSEPDYRAVPGMSYKSPIGTEILVDADSGLVGTHPVGTTVSVRQPLLRGLRPKVVLANYHDALDNEKINKLNLKNQLISTITSVIQSYHTLVQDYNALEIDELALKDSLRTLKNTKMKIKAGKAAATELTQLQAQVANQKLSITRGKNAIDRDKQALLILLGLDPYANIDIDRSINIEGFEPPTQERSIELALSNNVQYQEALISLKQRKRQLMVQKDNQLWRLDAVASASETFNQGIFDREHVKDVRLELDIPIDDKHRKQGLISAKIGLKQFNIGLADQKRRLMTDVINAIRDLKAQREQIKLAENSVKYSEESLDIAQKKFKHGRTTMFEITSLRQTLTQNRLSLIGQKISYLNTLVQFEQTLGISLKRWNLEINC